MQFKKITNKDGKNILGYSDIQSLILECADDEVILEVKYSAICGSDISNFKNNASPRIMGHEYSGTVFYCGSKVPKQFSNSELIYNVQPNVHCNQCVNCMRKNYSLCNDKKCYGYHYPGGYVEYTKINYRNLYSYGGRYENNSICSSLIEPVACIIKAIEKSNIDQGDSVLITGAGFTGLSMILYLDKKIKVKNIESVDIKKNNRKKSLELGASNSHSHIPKSNFDVVIDTTGNIDVINKSLKQLKPSGKLVIFGVTKENQYASLNTHEVWKKELTIIGTRSTSHSHEKALEFVKTHDEIFVKMITHRLKLECLKNVKNIVSQKNYIKGVICREKSL